MHELIKHFEGCHLEAYQDSGGIWTIGYGSTKGVKQGMKITQEKADELFDKDIEDAENRVTRVWRMGVDLDPNEYQALVSLAYNLRSFEKLAKYLPDKELFKKKMLLYSNDIKGNPLKGLKIRRLAERLLFEGRDWRQVLELQKQTMAQIDDKEKELFYI